MFHDKSQPACSKSGGWYDSLAQLGSPAGRIANSSSYYRATVPSTNQPGPGLSGPSLRQCHFSSLPKQPSWLVPYNPANPSPGIVSSDCLSPSPTNGTSSSSQSPDLNENIADEEPVTGVLKTTPGGRIGKKPLESGKPAYSYISLICMAIVNTMDCKATLREICSYIENRFPYYRSKDNWHGNIKHNLTLNDCFVKMPRREGDKGSPWAIDPQFADMFNGGSLLRRRYRFKHGSEKWHRQQAARQLNLLPKRSKNPVPKNAVVVPQADGSSKLVAMSPQHHSANTASDISFSDSIKIESQPAGQVQLRNKTSPTCTISTPINPERSGGANSTGSSLESSSLLEIVPLHNSSSSGEQTSWVRNSSSSSQLSGDQLLSGSFRSPHSHSPSYTWFASPTAQPSSASHTQFSSAPQQHDVASDVASAYSNLATASSVCSSPPQFHSSHFGALSHNNTAWNPSQDYYNAYSMAASTPARHGSISPLCYHMSTYPNRFISQPNNPNLPTLKLE